MQQIVSLILSLALAYGAAFIGSLFTKDAIGGWYAALVKPEVNPPGWLFGPVWAVLYTLMAVAAWRVYQKKSRPGAKKVLALYTAHLAVNVSWSLVFFGLHAPLFAFGVIIALLVCIIVLSILFGHIDRLAGLLFLPYLAWVLFAAYLNLTIVLLN